MLLYQLLFSFVFFLYGIIIGSFLLQCIVRIPRQQSVVSGRSCCPHCNCRLAPRDMVPILSWLFAKGRCRHCQTPISAVGPLFEGLTGLLFVLCFLTFGFTSAAFIHCLFASALLVGAAIDRRHTYIPDRISLIIVILALLLQLTGQGPSITAALCGSIAVSGLMLLIRTATGGGIGLGDIKLFAATGLFLGLPKNVLAYFAGYILAAAFCLPLLCKRRLTRGSEIPMAPYFAAALMLSALAGDWLIDRYLSLFY